MSENITLSWDLFRTRHPDDGYRKAFEDLCKNLFARKLNVKPSDLVEYHNQKGIEVEPIEVDGDVYSFQSKFSNNDSVLWSQFKTSTKKTVEEYSELTKVIHYTNGTSGRSNKTRDAIEVLYRKNNIIVEWIYKKSILELLEEESNTDLRKKYFGGGQDLNIRLPNVATTVKSLSALKYQSEIVGFIGRENELSQLQDFNESSNLVQWWIIGGTGGSGKSRLALQLGKVYEAKGWNCGFINSLSDLNLDEWNPERPHLLICDYVLNREEDISKLIYHSISLEDNDKLSFPIRIVLLERDANPIIKTLNNTPTFGLLIEKHLYDPTALTLLDFKTNDLKIMLEELATFFELPSDKLKDLYAFVENNNSRAFLMGGLFCLYYYNQNIAITADSFEGIIRDLIEDEKKRWSIDQKDENFLILATMVGGIDLKKPELLQKDVTELLEDSYNPKVYKKVIGQDSYDYLAPFSHDLINELYVLDALKPLNPLNNEAFSMMIRLSLGVDSGKELVSFFTRAANDYQDHPTLKELLRQFSVEESPFTIWLLILSNVIDKIDETLEKKVDLFSSIYNGLVNSPDVYSRTHHILDGLYIRLLVHITGPIELNEWVGEYSIVEPKATQNANVNIDNSTVPIEKIDENLYLKPIEYCESVISAFSQLDTDYKNKMGTPTLFEANHHFIMHKLSSRSADLDEIDSLLKDAVKVLDPRLNIGLIYTNTIIGFIQWGYIRNKEEKEKVLEMTTWMLDELESRGPSIQLASCYSIATQIVSETIRTFDARKKIMDRFNSSFGDKIESDSHIASSFIGACVAIMSCAFKSNDEYNYAKGLIERSKQLLDKYPTSQNAENFTLAIVQLARYRGEYASNEEKVKILDKSIATAKTYGNTFHNIVQNVVSEISTRYNENNPIEEDNILLAKAIDLVTYFKDDYTSDTKVQMGGFYSEKFITLLETQNYESIKKLIDSMAYVQEFSFVELHHQMWSDIDTNLYNKWNTANREQNISVSKSLQDIAKYYLDNLPNGNMSKGLMEHIING